MGMLIKGDLLDIKVPIKQEIPLVVNNKWQKNYCGYCSGK